MSTIERLKALCDAPIPTDGFDKIRRDFEIQKATREVLPKLLAVVEKAEKLSPSCSDRRYHSRHGSVACGECHACLFWAALEALDKS